MHNINPIWAAPCENVSSNICGQRKPRSACASAQSDLGLCCPLTESLNTGHFFVCTISLIPVSGFFLSNLQVYILRIGVEEEGRRDGGGQPAHSCSLIRIFTWRFLDSQGCKVSSCRQRRLIRMQKVQSLLVARTFSHDAAYFKKLKISFQRK